MTTKIPPPRRLRQALTAYPVGLALLAVLASCAPEADLEHSVGQAEQPLFGEMHTEDCSSAEIAALDQARFLGRVTARSAAFSQCIQRAWMGTVTLAGPINGVMNPGPFGPYLSCDDDDATDWLSAARAAQSRNDLDVDCDEDIDFPPIYAQTGQDDGIFHDEDEEMKFGDWLRRIYDPATDGPLLAGVIWHEAMHTHGYKHGSSNNGNAQMLRQENADQCSRRAEFDAGAWDYQTNTAPYIVGYCIEGVLRQSATTCQGLYGRCDGGLWVVRDLDIAATSRETECECVRDADTNYHVASGTPSFIQSDFGDPGNFELVVPEPGGGIHHYWRDNSRIELLWRTAGVFGQSIGVVDDVSVIQSTFGDPGHLEVAARRGGDLFLFWQEYDRSRWGPQFVGGGAAGNPVLIQSTYNSDGHGNFEVIAPAAGVGVLHYWRNNSEDSRPWYGAPIFGAELGHIDAVGMIQGDSGNLEVAIRAQDRLYYMSRDGGYTWGAPVYIASGVGGTPVIDQGRDGSRELEIVVPSSTRGFLHFRRGGSENGGWTRFSDFGQSAGKIDADTMFVSNYDNGNMEVVARIEDELAFFLNRFGVWSGPHYMTGMFLDEASSVSVEIDATSLNAVSFNIDHGAPLPNQISTVRLRIGAHTFCAPASVACFQFEVTAAGTLDYAPSYDNYVSGRGGYRLTARGFAITVDPTALDAVSFNVQHGSIGGQNFANEVRTFTLLPGSHSFCAPASAHCFQFLVTPAGLLDYDAGLDALLQGRGGPLLTVTGVP